VRELMGSIQRHQPDKLKKSKGEKGNRLQREKGIDLRVAFQ
jgi:hypothetical protein